MKRAFPILWLAARVCSRPAEPPAPVREASATTLTPPAVPLLGGLGSHSRKITTSSPEAQRYFDQGLAFLYAFNDDEATRSFQEAARLEPAAAMAWWDIAVADGPHINYPLVPPEREKAAVEALARTEAASASASAVERGPLPQPRGAPPAASRSATAACRA